MSLVYNPVYCEDRGYYLSLHGLKIDEHQTFGVEFEIACPGVDLENKSEWNKKAQALVSVLNECFSPELVNSKPVYNYEHVKDVDCNQWNVVYDGSCGFEIVTPILNGKRGFETLVDFLKGLRLSGVLEKEAFSVDFSTGTHIHLGWNYRKNPEKMKKMLKMVYKYEGAINTLLPVSRVMGDKKYNEYCRTIRSSFRLKQIEGMNDLQAVEKFFGDEDNDRYRSLNMTKYLKKTPTLEVRSHAGTLCEKKITSWISFWMNCINSVDRLENVKFDELVNMKHEIPGSGVENDVVLMAKKLFHLKDLNTPFLTYLHERRVELAHNQYWKELRGEEETKKMLLSWENNIKEYSLLPEQSKNLFDSNIYFYSSLTKVLQDKVARQLIETNGLKISQDALKKSLNQNILLVNVVNGAVLATLGLKLEQPELLHNKLMKFVKKNNFENSLKVKMLLEGKLLIEKGWAYSTPQNSSFKKMNFLLDFIASKFYPEKRQFGLVVKDNVEGSEYMLKGGFQPQFTFTSPWSSNELIFFLKLHTDEENEKSAA